MKKTYTKSDQRLPLELRTETPSQWHGDKWLLDRALAALLLIAAMPLICCMVVIIRVTSSGPAIFRQVRVGKGGRHFTMFKLRTMIRDSEAKTGPVWTQDKDSRMTWSGRALRKIHLD